MFTSSRKMLLLLDEMTDDFNTWSKDSLVPWAKKLLLKKNLKVTWRSLEVNKLYRAKNQNNV